MVRLDVFEMIDLGMVKIRYVGGWVIRMIFEVERWYVRDNMYIKDVWILSKV